VIEWGDRIYGADAAARAYFGVSAGGLSAEQSALLAGAIANPRVMRPEAPSRRLRARQRMILRRMSYGVRPTDPRSLAAEAPVEDTPDEPEDKPEPDQPEPLPTLPQAPPPAPPTPSTPPPEKPSTETPAPPRPQPFPIPGAKPVPQPQR
jgi:monofunctional biosynthetic peptidoglycan transglycosylase